MRDIPPPSALTIRNAFENVHRRIVPLVQRWRLRRISAEIQRLFEELAAALERSPGGDPDVIEATSALFDVLEHKAPSASRVIDPVLDALFQLYLALTDGMPIITTNVAEMTDEERAEFQQVMAEERARQAAGLPPSDHGEHDCAICAVLARQRERRAS